MLSKYHFFPPFYYHLGRNQFPKSNCQASVYQTYTICTLWYMEIRFSDLELSVAFSALWFSSVANSREEMVNFPWQEETFIHWLQCYNGRKWLSQVQQTSEVAAAQTRWRQQSTEMVELQALQTFAISHLENQRKLCPAYLRQHQLPGDWEAQAFHSLEGEK